MKRKKHVGFEIRGISNMIKRRLDNIILQDDGQTATGVHGWVIGYLYDNMGKDVFQRDLESEFRIRRSTITEIIKLMEKNGYIKREPVSYDARLKKLMLTRKAVMFHEKIEEYIENLEEQITRDISDEDMDVFFAVMEKMKRNLTES